MADFTVSAGPGVAPQKHPGTLLEVRYTVRNTDAVGVTGQGI
jgi:hypothetical protein